MRLTVTTFVTLDGIMQSPGAPEEDPSAGFELGGWLPPYFDDELGAYMTGIFEQVDAFLLGRKTYDIFASYWPQQSGDPISDGLNRLPKHVVTNRTDELTWSGARRVDGADLRAAVTALKAQPGRELQVHGSGKLVGSLQREGLIDTYRVLIFPVVLGTGQRLFENGSAPAALRLTESRTSASGVTMQTYDAAGAPSFGSVAG
jgi:dihydrofolate reductase